MRTTRATTLAAAVWLGLGLCTADSANGNGGPFVVKYPNGDPAAKGVLARLDPSLRPQRETRLRVVKEDLTISFGSDPFPRRPRRPPVVAVSAAYTIENPTRDDVQVDFGFPILRGIYMSPWSMMPSPDVRVTIDEGPLQATIISNSLIYGIIRSRAREAIEGAIAGDPELERRVAAVRGLSNRKLAAPSQQTANQRPQTGKSASGAKGDRESARKALAAYLTGRLGWSQRDASLLVEYAGLQFGKILGRPHDRWHWGGFGSIDPSAHELLTANLGPLSAIGEQKATHLFAQVAGRFDQDSAAAYEAIFQAWGGDVRQRAVDLRTGRVRPRQLSLRTTAEPGLTASILGDPTVYARVDYLDPNAKLSDEEKSACESILKNLPVVFTFAPMNLLHYQASFPAQSERVITVAYKQYAFVDSGQHASRDAKTRSPASYQLAYVLHPASLWDDFGPIHLKLHVPKGVPCRTSVSTKWTESLNSADVGASDGGPIEVHRATPAKLDVYEATLARKADKTGELFVGVDKAAWDELDNENAPQAARVSGGARDESPDTSQAVALIAPGVELPVAAQGARSGPADASWQKAGVLAAGGVASSMILLGAVWAGLARRKSKKLGP